MTFFRIFEVLVLLGLVYLVFKFLTADVKIINKKVNDEIKKGENSESN